MKNFKKLILSSFLAGILLINQPVFANNSQIVKISVGSKIANVNGVDVELNVAPYIQQTSGSMMIPLKFVSTALGIPESNIQYNAKEKSVTITYNGTTAKFMIGTDKVYINGKRYTMFVSDTYSSNTEVKNGSTFIPLRSFETLFGIKIDWEGNTKTAIMSNQISNIQQNIPPLPNSDDPIDIFNQLYGSVLGIEINKPNQNINNIQKIQFENEEELRKEEDEIIKLVNEERKKLGLNPLNVDEDLMYLARLKSKDMIDNNYFDHTSPIYGQPFEMLNTFNVNFFSSGENISKRNSAKEAFDGWMQSTRGHKEAILSQSFNYIGVGYYTDNNGNKRWTQLFISK